MFIVIILISLFMLVYLYLVHLVMIGLQKSEQWLPYKNSSLNGISLIIPVRNEENQLPILFQSLEKLTTSDIPFELIFVNDHSTDLTISLIEDFIKVNSWAHLVHAPKPTDTLQGKANAIHIGILSSTYDIICLSDADMTFQSTAFSFIFSKFNSHHDIDMICGVSYPVSPTFFGKIQMVDGLFLMGIAAGLFHSNHPITAIGNNMSFRKTSYQEVGGYPSIPFSVTEDFELFKTFIHDSKTVYFSTDAEMTHQTLPQPTITDYVNQRKRWIKGGLEMNWKGIGILSLGPLSGILFLIAWLFSPLFGLLITGLRLFAHSSILLWMARKNALKISIMDYLAFEVFYFSYSIFIPIFIFISPSVDWKGRSFH